MSQRAIFSIDFGLERKLAFVGGASRGIGTVIALELAREGADMVAGSRCMPHLERTAAEIVETTGRRAISPYPSTPPTQSRLTTLPRPRVGHAVRDDPYPTRTGRQPRQF